jgi:glycosyltransferase involved in cell wall biosynthesis
MRVAHVIDSLAPGGAERSLADLVSPLIRLDTEVHFILLHERDGLAHQVEGAGAPVHYAGGAGRLAWLAGTTRLLRSLRPDLVNTTLFDSDVVGRMAARMAGVPCVTTLVNTPYGPEHKAEAGRLAVKIRAAQLADLATAGLACRFRAVSEAVKHAYVDRLRLKDDLVEVIPEGRDPRVLGVRQAPRRDAARSLLGLAVGDTAVLAVGRQEPQKGFDVLLRALPRLAELVPSATVFIAGRPGRASDDLSALMERLCLHGRVQLLGHRDDVAELMCAADVLVLPSRREGIPGVLQEAMALEVPIVAADIPPVREALAGGDLAELFPSGDERALAEAVARVLGRPAEAKRRAEAARRRFLAEYDIAVVATRLLRFYEAALSTTSHGPAG